MTTEYYCGKCGVGRTPDKSTLCKRCQEGPMLVQLAIVHDLPHFKKCILQGSNKDYVQMGLNAPCELVQRSSDTVIPRLAFKDNSYFGSDPSFVITRIEQPADDALHIWLKPSI